MQWLRDTLAQADDVTFLEPAFRFQQPDGEDRRAEQGGGAAPRASGKAVLPRSKISSLHNDYLAGRSDPEAWVETALTAAREATESFGAFLDIFSEEARQAAEDSKRRYSRGKPLSLLDGIPVAIKDVIDIADRATTGGSPLFRTRLAQKDGRCVQMLREAGAIPIGKTALHEWAYGVTSDNPFFGRVRNPRDPERIPGGSSGGSAVAVAAGAAPVALGSDTGGSIRIPAACCGLVGYKPSYDLISREGGVPQAWSLDHLGPITLSVADAWLTAAASARGTLADYGAIAAECARADGSLSGMKLGVLKGWDELTSDEVAQTHGRRLRLLEEAGAELVDYAYPDFAKAEAAWLTILVAESAAYHSVHLQHQPQQISDGVRQFLELGQEVSAVDYLRAQQIRAWWSRVVRKSMEGVDAIVSPTLPTTAPHFDQEVLQVRKGEVSLRDGFVGFQCPANFLGAPSISLPGKLSEAVLPQGLMLTGSYGQDTSLLRLALKVEQCLDHEGSS